MRIALARPGWFRRPRPSFLLMTGLVLTALILVAYPIGTILYGSIWSAPPGTAGHFTLSGFATAYSDPELGRLVWTTLWLAVVRSVLVLALALFLVWIIARTDTPGRGLLEELIWMQLYLPALPMILGWVLLAGPRVGLINQALMGALDVAPLNIYSAGGIIWVGSLGWVSFVTVFLLPAFRTMDATLEESSRLSGAGAVTTFVRITVPLLAPAVLAVTLFIFVRMLESFEVELFLGYPAGIWVFTTKIFDYIMREMPPRYPAAMALANSLLVVTLFLVVLQWRILGRREFVTVTGRGYRPAPTRLGRWRYVTFAFVVLYFLITMVLPLSMVLLTSFMRIAGLFDLANPFTLDNWRSAFTTGPFWSSFSNTLIVSFASATLGMVLFTLVAYVVLRTTFLGRKALDLIAWLPLAVPALVLALGILWAVMLLPAARFLYGTLWVMILAFIARSFPVGTRSITSTMVQVHRELEDSSRTSGATWLQTFRRIWLPHLRGGFLAGWILIFLLATRDLVTVVFLYTAESSILATLFFSWWRGGAMEKASILGLVMAAITIAGVVLVRLVARERRVVA